MWRLPQIDYCSYATTVVVSSSMFSRQPHNLTALGFLQGRPEPLEETICPIEWLNAGRCHLKPGVSPLAYTLNLTYLKMLLSRKLLLYHE
jgi:hypothetical protein